MCMYKCWVIAVLDYCNVLQNGMTCAHIAASKGSVAVIKELMRFNKAIVSTARNKVTAAFSSIKYKNSKL